MAGPASAYLASLAARRTGIIQAKLETMRRLLFILPALLPALTPARAADGTPVPVGALDRKEPVSYEKDIEPIVADKCIGCHSAKVRRGRYDMSTPEKIVQGGKRGPAVVPGKSAESLLVKVVSHTAKPYMPPRDEDPLTLQELALVKHWIDQGAKGPAVAAVKAPAPVTLRPLPAGVQPVRALALSPDKALLAAGRGNQLHLFDPQTGALVRWLTGPRPPAAHGAIVESLAFAPDGTVLASGSFREVFLWDPQTGAVKRRLTGFADRVVTLAFSPDGRLLATGGGAPTADGEIRLFDTATAKPVLELPAAHGDTVFGVSFSPDGTKLASGGADKLVKVWEVPTGKLLKTFEGHTHHVLDVAWKADGKLIASAGADDVIKVWDFEKGEQARTIKGHGKQVTRLTFVGTTATVLTCSGDGTARLWNAATGSPVRTFAGGPDFLYAVAASADGAVIAAGGEGGAVRVFGADGKLRQTLAPDGK
jgi:hypothetical protein